MDQKRREDLATDGLTLVGVAIAGAGFYLLLPPLLLVFLGLLILAVGIQRSR